MTSEIYDIGYFKNAALQLADELKKEVALSQKPDYSGPEKSPADYALKAQRLVYELQSHSALQSFEKALSMEKEFREAGLEFVVSHKWDVTKEYAEQIELGLAKFDAYYGSSDFSLDRELVTAYDRISNAVKSAPFLKSSPLYGSLNQALENIQPMIGRIKGMIGDNWAVRKKAVLESKLAELRRDTDNFNIAIYR